MFTYFRLIYQISSTTDVNVTSFLFNLNEEIVDNEDSTNKIGFLCKIFKFFFEVMAPNIGPQRC